MACKDCGKTNCTCGKNNCAPAAAIQINNTETVLFRKVLIPASTGDETTNPPVPGAFCNALVVYEATGAAYLYSSDGIPTRIDGGGDTQEIWKAIHDEAETRSHADQEIWTEIETIEASSDVVDVVGTYAELQSYDTSKLHANDLIKVLQDETKDDAITYYRWNGTSFTYVGAEGPYYTASETDVLLSGKQDTLIAGTNIQIAADGKTISATDTTYTHFTGATASTDGAQGLVPGPLAGDENKVLKGDGTWGTIQSAANTIFYMNSSESGSTRHIYKSPDMTGLASSKDVFDANELGQVILRISTSVTPDQYSDCYLQNAYKATGDYQLLFLDEKTYRSFDTTNINDTTFYYGARVLQSELTAGTNIQINGTTISATDTTYSNFVGSTALADGAAGLVPAPQAGDEGKFLQGDGTWATVQSGGTTTTFHWGGSPNYSMYKDSGYTTPATYSDIATAYADGLVYIADGEDETTYVVVSDIPDAYTITVTGIGLPGNDGGSNSYAFASSTWTKTATQFQTKLSAGTNVQINGTTISATDTTYSAFGGATSSVAGSAGLVPAPTTSDPDKYLKGDGTWANLPATNNISSNDWSALWQ